MAKMQFDKELSYKYTSNVIEAPVSDKKAKNSNEVRLFFSIGRRDSLTPKSLVKFITEKANISGKKINKIDILDNFSFVSVNKEVADLVMKKCIGNKLNKRKINIEVANKKK